MNSLLPDSVKEATTVSNTNFDHIVLTFDEIDNCERQAREAKVRSESLRLYNEYCESGMGQIEASAKASRESENVELFDSDLEPYINSAKEAKHYREKVNAYFKKVNEPKQYEVSNERYLNHVLGQLKEKTGSETVTKELSLLFNYFTGGVCNLDPGKGLLVVGNIGCGKTTLMNIFRDGPNPFRIVSCREVSEAWKKHGDISKYCSLNQNSLTSSPFGPLPIGICFDDLGIENKTKNYGDEANAMEEVLLNWYDKKKFNKVHITTNLTPDEIEAKYGKRVRSRMKEMFNLVQFEGGDLRK